MEAECYCGNKHNDLDEYSEPIDVVITEYFDGKAYGWCSQCREYPDD